MSNALARQTAAAAAALLAAIAAVAMALRLAGAAGAARDWLAFGFARPPATLGEAVRIAEGNLRLAAAVLFAAFLTGPRPAIRLVLDLVVGSLAALNTTAAGIALAAYGTRLLAAVAAHAPLELAGYAVALGAYLRARRGLLDGQQWAAAAAACAVLLAGAALLETYVQIGAGS